MGHSWKDNVCRICELKRHVVRPAIRFCTTTSYGYTPKGHDRFSHICPACDDGQIPLFERLLPPPALPAPPKEPDPPPELPKPYRSGSVEYERPVRDLTPVTMVINSHLTLEMDPDGRWGGTVGDWTVGVLVPRQYKQPHPDDGRVRVHDTFPLVLEEVERFMVRYRRLEGVRVYAKNGSVSYQWAAPPARQLKGVWKLCR